MNLETVDGLRAWLAIRLGRMQLDHALLWSASEEHRHRRGPHAVALQERLASDHQSICALMEMFTDEPFLKAWVKRINRQREKDERDRARRQAEHERRLAAMSPAERATYDAELQSARLAMSGLFKRDVQ